MIISCTATHKMSSLTDITEIGHICVCDSPKQQKKCQGTGRTLKNHKCFLPVNHLVCLCLLSSSAGREAECGCKYQNETVIYAMLLTLSIYLTV